eukprot:TRINITY_DN67177_c2_g2_i3.p1 TRINITY_DN67177_c2_g2~~TRINITY_DN67177_c2_g2_i3.p1  ORF type:complete len:487 (+),score=87.67 TRINITY_DN67177_c2_g2_i3:84-1544(+)
MSEVQSNTSNWVRKSEVAKKAADQKSWPLPFPRPESPSKRRNRHRRNKNKQAADSTEQAQAAAPAKKGNNNKKNTPNNNNNKTGGKKKKPRTEVPHGDSSNPVCLDHLKGVCAQKRWKCKYAHPPLWLVPKNVSGSDCANAENTEAGKEGEGQSQQNRHVCTVFVLTGYCKYGDKCFGLHPRMEDNAFCLPATAAKPLSKDVLKSLNDSGDEATSSTEEETVEKHERGSESAGSEDTALSNGTQHTSNTSGSSCVSSPSTVSSVCSGSNAQTGVKKALGLLNKITAQSFDKVLIQIFKLLTCEGDDGVSLQQLVPLLFAKAITEPIVRPLYARICKHLHDLLPADQQPGFVEQISDLINQLLLQDLTGMAEMKKRLIGTGEFVGQLYLIGLFKRMQLLTRVAQLIQGTCNKNNQKPATTEEAAMTVEIICSILTIVGLNLEANDSVALDHLLSTLETNTKRQPIRIQLLVENLKDLRVKGWRTKRV